MFCLSLPCLLISPTSHVLWYLQPRERPLRELKYGEKVIAKYKNNRYYKCNIVGERDQLFYHVLFDDGTFSDNLFAQDIEVSYYESLAEL